MFRSWKIGTAFGIGIYLHWSFLLLLLWVFLGQDPATGLGGGLFLVGLVLTMFGCVVLHELGHALAARWFGIRTRHITLFAIGGVARLERMSDKPGEEALIAVAGPAVNVAIILGLAGLLSLGSLLAPALLAGLPGQFLLMLLLLNVGMVLFNLIPAFPMDGGRVLRAVLTLFLGRLPATRLAAWVTTVVALAGGILGALYLHSPWLPIVAVFIYLAAQQELLQVEREALRAAQPIPLVPPVPLVRPVPLADPLPTLILRPTVTVYVWDGRNGTWVRQGTV